MGWFGSKTVAQESDSVARLATYNKLKFISQVTGDDVYTVRDKYSEQELDEVVRQCEFQQDTEKLRDLARSYVSNNAMELLKQINPAINANKLVNLITSTRLFNVVIDENSEDKPKLQVCESYVVDHRCGEHKLNIEIVVGRNWDRCVFDLTV